MTEIFSSEQVLNSWKEIAHYLNRGVRTAQRWESELGLPVRRPRGKDRSAVIAIRSELDQWLRLCPLGGLHENDVNVRQVNAPVDGNGPALVYAQGAAKPKLSDLLLHSRLLRSQLDRSVGQLQGCLDKLLDNMQTLTQTRTSGGGRRLLRQHSPFASSDEAA